MNRLLVLAVLGSTSLASVPAMAADIIVPPPVEYIEVEPVKEDYSGWYIRGDVGYVFESETTGDYRIYDPYGHGDRYHYDEIRLEDSFTFGAGAGYRFAEHFRTDASVDYFKSDLRGSSACPVGLFGSNCHFDDSSDADVWTVMANAYVDLPYFGPLTPYFGAGLGFAHVSYGDMENRYVDNHGYDIREAGYHEGEESWRFAASLMAGASFDITRNLKLDAGYRYTRIHDGDAFGYDEEDKARGATGVQGRDDGFDIHAVRAGLRYEFF